MRKQKTEGLQNAPAAETWLKQSETQTWQIKGCISQSPADFVDTLSGITVC